MAGQTIMHIRNVTKSFTRGGEKVTVLKKPEPRGREGEFLRPDGAVRLR